MARKSLACSLLVVALLLISSLSSSTARILQDSSNHLHSDFLVSTDDNVFNKKETDVSVGEKRINGATNYNNMGEDVKKCDEGAVKIGVNNVECSKKKQFPGFKEDVVQEAGFVAFNADYNSPRHHPPKNN